MKFFLLSFLLLSLNVSATNWETVYKDEHGEIKVDKDSITLENNKIISKYVINFFKSNNSALNTGIFYCSSKRGYLLKKEEWSNHDAIGNITYRFIPSKPIQFEPGLASKAARFIFNYVCNDMELV